MFDSYIFLGLILFIYLICLPKIFLQEQIKRKPVSVKDDKRLLLFCIVVFVLFVAITILSPDILRYNSTIVDRSLDKDEYDPMNHMDMAGVIINSFLSETIQLDSFCSILAILLQLTIGLIYGLITSKKIYSDLCNAKKSVDIILFLFIIINLISIIYLYSGFFGFLEFIEYPNNTVRILAEISLYFNIIIYWIYMLGKSYEISKIKNMPNGDAHI